MGLTVPAYYLSFPGCYSFVVPGLTGRAFPGIQGIEYGDS